MSADTCCNGLPGSMPLLARRMKPEDVEEVAAWAKSPRIARWFDAPNYAAELAGHLSDDRVQQWIYFRGDQAVAYVQDYRVHGWDQHPLGFLPKDARGIDMFIANEALMGQGLGPSILRQHCASLIACGASAIGIDPHPDNIAAIRCYTKAGFASHNRVATQWGDAHLMVLRPEAWPVRGRT